ncbi:hypothetical protein [Verrucomicrobium sp. 3C]|uniref:hypothetical protein n=1 Tax=Verrucomicrobium sp. 3C TaxID=1134055 RepID=UPI0003803E51|nr:hypothetical protein [Verrucomicrobium sp. 3C]
MDDVQGINRDPLDELLRSWRPEGRLPGNFQNQVWERVAFRSQEILPPARRRRRAWMIPAAASLLACLVATTQARHWSKKRWSELRAEYFQTIDPQALAAAQRRP